jgi:hypothetical protein
MRGPHGIPVETCGGDLVAASTFNGVIEAEEHDPARDEHSHQDPEQESTGVQGRPDGAI